MSGEVIILCDVDGVLADPTHRLRFLDEKDYDKFYGARMADDGVIEAGVELVNRLRAIGESEVFFISGRPERTRGLTKMWIENKAHITVWNDDNLLMRKDHDWRPAHEIKVEAVRRILGDDKEKFATPLSKYIQVFRAALKRVFCVEPTPPLVYFIDDDPENVKAVCDEFPNVCGLLFGMGRVNRIEKNE